jgi:hypothetical protein
VNHDFESAQQTDVTRYLSAGGIVMREKEPAVVEGIGFADVKDSAVVSTDTP